MKNKEQIYDEQIAPLMAKIIEICKTEDIQMFAEFQYADLDFCTTTIYPEVDGRNVTTKLYNVLSQCKMQEGANIDQFCIHLARNYLNKSSIVMKMLGNEPPPVRDQNSPTCHYTTWPKGCVCVSRCGDRPLT